MSTSEHLQRDRTTPEMNCWDDMRLFNVTRKGAARCLQAYTAVCPQTHCNPSSSIFMYDHLTYCTFSGNWNLLCPAFSLPSAWLFKKTFFFDSQLFRSLAISLHLFSFANDSFLCTLFTVLILLPRIFWPFFQPVSLQCLVNLYSLSVIPPPSSFMSTAELLQITTTMNTRDEFRNVSVTDWRQWAWLKWAQSTHATLSASQEQMLSGRGLHMHMCPW